MSILVTGGAGFIGSHVCEALLNKDIKVICIDNFNDYYNPKFKEENIRFCSKDKNFKLYREDITNIENLKLIFEKNKIEKIIHLAARAGVRASIENPLLYEKANVLGTLNMLILAKMFDIKNFVFGSSSSIYGNTKEIPFFRRHKNRQSDKSLCRYQKVCRINVLCL